MITRLLFLLCFSLLTSCVTYTTAIDPAKTAALPEDRIAQLHFYWEKHPELASPAARQGIEADLRRRGWKDRDFSAVRNRVPYVGMRTVVLAEALGKPLRNNYTQTRYGTSQQLIFGSRFLDQPYYIVYTDNGVVTGIQNNPFR